MAVTLISGADAYQAVGRGVNQLADVIRGTLGPVGRGVVLNQVSGKPRVSSSGAAIAKDVSFSDAEEAGAQLLRATILQVEEEVRDGTATTAVLAQAMIREGWKNLAAGFSPVTMSRGISAATEKVIEGLTASAVPVTTHDTLVQVASASSGNHDLGALVAEALEYVNRRGIVTVRDSPTEKTYVEKLEGYQYERGYVSPHFSTDAVKLEATLNHPYVLLYDGTLDSVREFGPLLEALGNQKASLLILAEDVVGDALATLILNHTRNRISVCCAKAPGFGLERRELLEDISALTGGTVFYSEGGCPPDKALPEMLGRLREANITRERTTLIGGRGTSLAGRLRYLKTQIAYAPNKYTRDTLQERLSRLTDGAAILRVGAPTEYERSEIRLRIEAALHTSKAALEEGILPGGGVAYLRQSVALGYLLEAHHADEGAGIRMVKEALQAPLCQIAENAGYDPKNICTTALSKIGPVGFDAQEGVFCDLIEAGILDAAKVLRIALEKAASLSSLLLTTHALALGPHIPTSPSPDPDTYRIDPSELFL
mgnify:CR=1 FL=1